MKVGDKVTVVKIDDEYYDRVGMITNINTGYSLIFMDIKFADSTVRAYEEQDLQPAFWEEIRKQRRQFEERLRNKLSSLERNDAISKASQLFKELSKII